MALLNVVGMDKATDLIKLLEDYVFLYGETLEIRTCEGEYLADEDLEIKLVSRENEPSFLLIQLRDKKGNLVLNNVR